MYVDLLRAGSATTTLLEPSRSCLGKSNFSADGRHQLRRWLVSYYGHRDDWPRVAEVADAV